MGRWIFAIILASLAFAAQSTPTPQAIACGIGQITWLSGTGPARTPLLLFWHGRPVGGGSVNPAGFWKIPLQVGQERPGRYLVEVRARGANTLISAFECAVGVTVPTALPATPTPNPLITNGDDRYNCDDFATWQDANAAFQANQPGDPNELDTDGDGIPCEDLPGAPAR